MMIAHSGAMRLKKKLAWTIQSHERESLLKLQYFLRDHLKLSVERSCTKLI